METLQPLIGLAPLNDPLAGVIVWGSAGLIAWCTFAALAGVALGVLRQLSGQRPAAPAICFESDEDHQVAA